MIRRLGWLVSLVASSLAVATASAQSSSVLVLFGGTTLGPPVSTTNIPAQLTGSLTISFHGDLGTGCVGEGVCGYSGTVVVRPGRSGAIAVAAYGGRRHRSYQAAMSLGGLPVGELTAAHVTRVSAGLCSDAQHPFVSLPATIASGLVTLPLLQPGGTLLSTRCAGPLDGDLAGLAPHITLPVRDLVRGHRTFDLSETRSFAAGGFAGTIDSTLRLALGKPVTENLAPRGIKTRLVRAVSETLAITHLDGQSSFALTSDEATCQFLDSCGLSGSVTAMNDPSGATGSVTVIGPASRPYPDFLAALGLTRHGNPSGLQVIGTIGWSVGGTVTSDLNQGTRCTSQVPAGEGAVLLLEHGSRVGVTYTTPNPARTRCPGPAFPEGTTLARGTIPIRDLGLSSFTLRLSGSGHLSDDGYSVDQRTSLTLTLGRGRVHQQTFLAPAG